MKNILLKKRVNSWKKQPNFICIILQSSSKQFYIGSWKYS